MPVPRVILVVVAAFVTVCAAPFVLASPGAQPETTPAAMGRSYGAALDRDLNRLESYLWQHRAEVSRRGVVQMVALFQMRYSIRGGFDVTPVTQNYPGRRPFDMAPPPASGHHAELTALQERMQNFVQAYAFLSDEQALTLFTAGAIQRGSGSTVRVTARNLVDDGDVMVLDVDTDGMMPHRVRFTTSGRDGAIQGEIEFRGLRDGPFYVARARVHLPDHRTTVDFENFDFAAQGR